MEDPFPPEMIEAELAKRAADGSKGSAISVFAD
jgi:hypothetical protein